MTRELILLSPYRFPSHHTLMLNDEDVAAYLNGCLSLWHPAVLRQAGGPPQIGSPYDHEQPAAGQVFALPVSPPLFLAEDWQQRCEEAGAVFFHATAGREETQANLLSALGLEAGDPAWAAPFFGIGYGYVLLGALFEAMDHSPQLDAAGFWDDVRRAAEAEAHDAALEYLRAAADKLREARDILFPSNVFFLDLFLLEDRPAEAPLLRALELGVPCNVVLSGRRLQELAGSGSGWLKRLRERVHEELAEVCSGPYIERDDALLPLESLLWNLRKGKRAAESVLARELKVAARRSFGHSPQLPTHLHAAGLGRTILLNMGEYVIPEFRAAMTEWTAHDGRRIEALTRPPLPADLPATYLHLAYHLKTSMQQDATASLVFLHKSQNEPTWYHDWLELNRLGPVFGALLTVSQYMSQVLVGEYAPPSMPDEFHSNALEAAANRNEADPVSRFPRHWRRRLLLDAVGTLLGLYRGVTREPDDADLLARLDAVEDALEQGAETAAELDALRAEAGLRLADRLLARATAEEPGHLILNPAGFGRRVAVELEGIRTPLPAPAKATQPLGGGKARVVVDVPAFGFAWLPKQVAPGVLVAMPKTPLAEDRLLRTDVLEAEVDAKSGGLKALRDARWRVNRLGQQLSFGPGSMMRVKEIKTTSTGPALGEIVSAGEIMDGQDNVLAEFQQRFRVWRGRPIVELRIELRPRTPVSGYPWHAYYAARFAWRDPQAYIYRSTNMVPFATGQARPETGEWLEIRGGISRTAIFTGGLPFHQKHSQRMLDVILITEGERETTFDLALGLDLENPAQAHLDLLTPVMVVPTAKGPPHVGASAWLAHVDVDNVVITRLRPADEDRDALLFRLTETAGQSAQVQLRCPRNPKRAALVNDFGAEHGELAVAEDAVTLTLGPAETQQVKVMF